MRALFSNKAHVERCRLAKNLTQKILVAIPLKNQLVVALRLLAVVHRQCKDRDISVAVPNLDDSGPTNVGLLGSDLGTWDRSWADYGQSGGSGPDEARILPIIPFPRNSILTGEKPLVRKPGTVSDPLGCVLEQRQSGTGNTDR